MNYYLCSSCTCEWRGTDLKYSQERCPSCGIDKPVILVGKTQKECLNELLLTTISGSHNWPKDAFGTKILNKLIRNCT